MPLGALALGACWLLSTEPRPALQAAPSVVDYDRDGLPDALEVTLGTSPWLKDTDGDGWDDNAELAAKTSPWDPADFPNYDVTSPPTVGITARGEGGKLVLSTVVSVPDGDVEDLVLRFGLLRSGNFVAVSTERLVALGQTYVTSDGASGQVITLDVPLPVQHVLTPGSVTWAAVVGRPDSLAYSDAAVVELFAQDGVVLMRRRDGLLPPINLTLQSMTGGAQGPANVQQPIPVGGTGDLPASWQGGKVCYQLTEVVGTSGPFVISEVVQADCEGDWDSYCDTDCPGTVGTTFETIDPGALLGG